MAQADEEREEALPASGIGLLSWSVKDKADVVLDPAPYVPRPEQANRPAACWANTHAASAIPISAAQAMRAPLMTAYRQEALRCAELLAAKGP